MIFAEFWDGAASFASSVAREAAAFAGGVADLASHLAAAWASPSFTAVIGLCALVGLVDVVRRGFRIVLPRKIMIGTLATFAIVAANAALAPLVSLAAKGVRAAYSALHIPQIDPSVWANWPSWALALLAIAVYDFANYWNHRAMHRRWLWPIHAIHHSDPALTGFTTFRVHGLEALVMMASYTLMLSWLGLPADVLGGAAVLLGLHNAYTHVNVDWDHGPLKYVIASPRFHRWHHADVPEAHGKNLANVFPVFDLMFGTYYAPGRCDAAVGAQGVPENDVARLLLFPFAPWARMAEAGLRRLSRRVPAGEPKTAA